MPASSAPSVAHRRSPVATVANGLKAIKADHVVKALALLGGLAAAVPAAAGIACRPATATEAAFYTSPVAMPGVISPSDGTCYVKDQRIVATDGTTLAANVFLPRGFTGGQPPTAGLPGVVFIGSWASAEWFEYLGIQHRMAQAGYVAMAYTARGFWNSGGVVDVASAQDVRDVSSALDWMQAHTPVDVRRIGASGISYGAGLSMLAAAVEPRISAVTAMSGWGNLADQLYGQEVPNTTWTQFLVGIGAVTGRLDPGLLARARTTLDPDATPAQITELLSWAQSRSPSNVVGALNARGVPILIAKNWQDDMFSPNPTLDMYARLTTPKKLLLQPGIHGSAELMGAVLGTDNAVYTEATRWFDRWLKGVPNGVDTGPKVMLRPKLQRDRVETLSDWPAAELTRTTYALVPRGAIRWDWNCWCWLGGTGGLTTGAPGAHAADTINNLLDTVATTGTVPVLTVAVETFDLPIVASQPLILRDQGVRYEGPVLGSAMRIRGIPSVKLRVRPSQTRGMLVAYLYSVDALGMGTLITQGARAVHFAVPGKNIDFSMRLNATAFDVPAGNRIALVFDTRDSLYGAPVNTFESFSMSIEAGGSTGSALTLPRR